MPETASRRSAPRSASAPAAPPARRSPPAPRRPRRTTFGSGSAVQQLAAERLGHLQRHLADQIAARGYGRRRPRSCSSRGSRATRRPSSRSKRVRGRWCAAARRRSAGSGKTASDALPASRCAPDAENSASRTPGLRSRANAAPSAGTLAGSCRRRRAADQRSSSVPARERADDRVQVGGGRRRQAGGPGGGLRTSGMAAARAPASGWRSCARAPSRSAPPAATSSPGIPQTTAVAFGLGDCRAAELVQARHRRGAVVAHARHQHADEVGRAPRAPAPTPRAGWCSGCHG